MQFTKAMLTQSEVKARLNYDPDTGVFTRRRSKWSAIKEGRIPGHTDKHGYHYIRLGQVRVGAHRLAWLYVYGVLPNGLIDHRNGNPSDNRIDNLRVVNPEKNSWNARKASTNRSGYRGVSWHSPSKRWQAQITHNKQPIHLGYFDTRELAAEVYEATALRLRGEHHRRQKIANHPSLTTPKQHHNRHAAQPVYGYASKKEYRLALAKAVADGL